MGRFRCRQAAAQILFLFLCEVSHCAIQSAEQAGTALVISALLGLYTKPPSSAVGTCEPGCLYEGYKIRCERTACYVLS